MHRELILASTSPRRQELLNEAGYAFRSIAPDVEEWDEPSANADELVLYNARLKCSAIARQHPSSIVLAADTTVALGDRLYAKPINRTQACQFLLELSGRSHVVATAICIQIASARFEHAEVVHSTVAFRVLSMQEIERYIDEFNPLDKAGAYAIQDGGEKIVSNFDGSLSNIIGLPMERVSQLLHTIHTDPALR